MSETYAMYYDAPEKQEFDANIVSSEATEKGVLVELDRTLFYPEGGGQPADRGNLDGIVVLDVRKDDDGRITHLLPEKHPGKVVHGTIDWNHRRDFMQQHTGQHIISAGLVKIGGYNTVAVHLGEDCITVETDAPDIPEEDLLETEDFVNRTICLNLPVRTFWIQDTEIHLYPFRRPPKVSGRIRIVEIPEFDCSACGGLHVERTGEVRLVKLVGTEKIRGHLRSSWKAGDRAIADYRRKTALLSGLSRSLSVPEDGISGKVSLLQSSLRDALQSAESAQTDRARMFAELLRRDADQVHGFRLVKGALAAENPVFVRKLTAELASAGDTAACITNTADTGLLWAVVLPESAPVPFSRVREELLPLIEGKGGGRPPVYQGGGRNPGGAQAFIEGFSSLLRAP